MCRPVECNVCHKTTWAGCGQHIAQVKAMVPANQWCDGKHTQAEINASSIDRSLLGRLFG